MTRAHLSSLTAWGPLPTCVVVPVPPINRSAADSESDDGLVLPLRNGKLPRYSAPMRTGIQGVTLDILLCHEGERSWMPNNRLTRTFSPLNPYSRRLFLINAFRRGLSGKSS